MSNFAAIPTVYRGIQMCSRLEAKWACVFYSDRTTIIKVEQALGAPKPAELRLVHEEYSSEAWDIFYETLQYEVLLLGAAPRTGMHGQLIIGWQLNQHCGWGIEPIDLCDSAALDRAWRIACNTTQWKAPR